MFNYALLCEDIREEANGKRTIVGLLSGDVIVSQFPADIRVAFFIDYTKEEVKKEELLSLRIKLNDLEVANAEITLLADPKKNCSISLPMAFLHIEKESTLSLSAKIDDNPEETILSKKILGRL